MDKITRGLPARVGVDLSRRVIQVHAVDAQARMITNRDKFVPWCAQLPPGCLVVMEISSSDQRPLLGAQAADHGLGRAHRLGPLGSALPQRRPSRQERRQ
jgi:hypothetical protein